MSRYIILLMLNLPFILAGILNAVTQYKLNKSSKKRVSIQIGVWVMILIGLLLAKPLYEWLFENKLTDSESLSLFDVIQTTGILLVFYMANRTRLKVEHLETRLNDLHQEVSIRLSEKTRR